MFFCCKKASTSIDCPVGFRLKTSISQLLDILPLGPNSSIATMIRPVNQRTNRIKAPIMTIAGSKRRCAINQKRPKMKRMVRPETVM